METKHTPGPWRWNTAAGIYGSNNKRCANVFVQDEIKLPDDEIDANARLIAAAPDLLALVRSYATTYPLDEYYDKATAAIAKATGDK